MNDNLSEICVVLDRTGSMEACRQEAINGFNQFVSEQKKVAGECRLTLIQFDSQDPHEVVHDRIDVQSVSELTTATYVPRSMTPLWDAIGHAVVSLGEKLSKIREDELPSKVIFVILTDGNENASKEYTEARVRDMIKHQRETYNWQFVFLGANIESQQVAAAIAIDKGTSADFDQKVATSGSFALAGQKVASYRASGQSAALNYTDGERKYMKTGSSA